MFHRSVCGLVPKFKPGFEHLKYVARQVGPAAVTTNNYIVKIQQILQIDASYTARQLAWMTNLSLGRDYGILKKKKINGWWIPQLLNDKQTRVRVENANNLLKLY